MCLLNESMNAVGPVIAHLCAILLVMLFQGTRQQLPRINFGYLYSLPGLLKILFLQLLYLFNEEAIASSFRINPLFQTFF